MRDNDTAETTREAEELQDELESPTENLDYVKDVDWEQEATLSGMIDEEMVKDIASQLAQATVEVTVDATGQESSPDHDDEYWSDEDDFEGESEGAEAADTQDHENDGDQYDQDVLDDIIEDILDDGSWEGEPDAAAFAESPLAASQDLRVLDRYGPPTAGVGLVVLGMTVGIAFAIGTIVQNQVFYFLSPVALTVALTLLLGSFAYLLCRSWFKQAWEHRNHVLDAAAATVLEIKSKPAECSDETRRIFDESLEELYSRLRSEIDERSEKLREDTHRDVQKTRIFFETLLEKHVQRINDDLHQKTSEVEKLQLQRQDGEKTGAEVTRLIKENERLKTQFEDLELELEHVDKDRRLKEEEVEELRRDHLAESDGRNREIEEKEQAHRESSSENERLKSKLADLEADLKARGEDCKRMTSEIEELVQGADRASQDGIELFGKVSGQLTRNLQLASRLAAQLGGGGNSNRTADSDSSLTTEISGHLENLERLISQIVDLGKLQSSSGKTTARSEVKIKDLLHDCVDRVRASADQSGIKVSIQAAKDLPKVSMDRGSVARAVDELVANAVIYTNPGGRVTVRALLDADEAGSDILRLTVQDNGQGMTKGELESIFEPFARGEHPRLSLSGAGAGLGLALAKGYAEKLGGSIAVESKHGKGSTFTIKVPVDVVS